MHRNSSPAFLDVTDQDWEMQWCLIVKWDSIPVRWRWGGHRSRGPAKGDSREWELFWKLIQTALLWTPRSEVGGEESLERQRRLLGEELLNSDLDREGKKIHQTVPKENPSVCGLRHFLLGKGCLSVLKRRFWQMTKLVHWKKKEFLEERHYLIVGLAEKPSDRIQAPQVQESSFIYGSTMSTEQYLHTVDA